MKYLGLVYLPICIGLALVALHFNILPNLQTGGAMGLWVVYPLAAGLGFVWAAICGILHYFNYYKLALVILVLPTIVIVKGYYKVQIVGSCQQAALQDAKSQGEIDRIDVWCANTEWTQKSGFKLAKFYALQFNLDAYEKAKSKGYTIPNENCFLLHYGIKKDALDTVKKALDADVSVKCKFAYLTAFSRISKAFPTEASSQARYQEIRSLILNTNQLSQEELRAALRSSIRIPNHDTLKYLLQIIDIKAINVSEVLVKKDQNTHIRHPLLLSVKTLNSFAFKELVEAGINPRFKVLLAGPNNRLERPKKLSLKEYLDICYKSARKDLEIKLRAATGDDKKLIASKINDIESSYLKIFNNISHSK